MANRKSWKGGREKLKRIELKTKKKLNNEN